MEGSPVRGQERGPLARLSEVRDIENFQVELVRIIKSEASNSEVFIGLFETTSRVLQIPAGVKSHLERHPALYKKLEQGEMVGISHTQDDPVLRPATAARSSVVLV